MPLITATVIAVAAAITATSVATVAAAAVAVGTLVGTVGLGLSVIGMATGNETLSKIGGYMGMAGGVLGLGGGLAGGMAGFKSALSTAWDDGVGSLFNNTKAVGLQQEAMGRAIVGGTNPQAASSFANRGLPMDAGVLGKTIASNPVPPPSTSAIAPKSGLDPGNFVSPVKPAPQITPDIIAASERANKIQAIANANPASTVGPSGAEAALDVTKQAASSVPGSGGQTPSPSSPVRYAGEAGKFQSIADRVNDGSMSGVGDFFNSLPDWAKGQLAITGVQGLAGMASGWFDSASAEQKLELERQAQQWNQQFNTKAQNFDQASRKSAPLVTFGSGTMGTPR